VVEAGAAVTTGTTVDATHRGARGVHAVALAGLAVVAVAAVFLALYPRLGFDADSVTYVGVGRNIAHGHGITYPFKVPGARLTDFPPGYPLLLGAADAVGLPIVGFAHVFQAFMLGLAGVLAGALVWSASRSRSFTVLAFLLVAAAPSLAEVFSTVYTEPLAIGLQLAALLLLALYAREARPVWLVGAGVCAALGPAVRWAGVSVIVTGVLVVLLAGPGTRRDRARRSACWGALALVPAAIVVLTNRGGGGSGTARELAWHPIGWSYLHDGFETVGSWFLPRQLHDRWLFGAAMVIGAVAAAVWFAARHGRAGVRRALARGGPEVAITWLFVVVYLATIVVSISVFDAATPLDARILAPLYAALVPAVVGAIAVWWHAPDRRDEATRAVAFALVVVVALVGVRAVTTATGDQTSRLGFNAASWHRSPLMRQLASLAPDTPVVTNAPEAVYLQTGRHARSLPVKYSSTSLQHDGHYPQKLTTLLQQVGDEGGVVAMFDEVHGRPWLAKAPELERRPDVRVLVHAHDGVLLGYSGP
jgi:hypothetical protein